MWTKEFFGTDVYHLVSAFVIYSMLGWLVESIYMSFCNRRLTNRGFAKSPFCPIYGFGAIIGYLILHPLDGHFFKLYLLGALMATVFEFLVGNLMLKLFGEIWWDYKDKPCNYKGIICLESTIAWGFYAVIIIVFLHSKIIGFIDSWSFSMGSRVCSLILAIVTIDYIIQLSKAFGIDIRERCADKYESFKARWY
ncbi:putative ABC transporter permease [Kineothrix sp. MB12-C1]|uniref:putative ABC transporter permease n=1 Tax=Kineothrix sp. MB12-C1 TaxID=3070215 RepID=UPI0027D289BF|nr:putative ABC transporter permease [Kineothrix sp. MB12-C1]WMC92401.1 putative ABC transporter permease [Kineothrix sp. MB12-C1]